jgi:hypothetical protein
MSDTTITPYIMLTSSLAADLVGRHGKSALLRIEENVAAARKRDDWLSVRDWRGVGLEAEKMLCGRRRAR